MLYTIKSHQMVGANDMKPSSREGRKNNRGLLPKEQNHGLQSTQSIQIVHPCKAVERDEAGIQTGCPREADRLTSREPGSPPNSPRNLPLNLQILPTQCLKDGILGGAQRIEMMMMPASPIPMMHLHSLKQWFPSFMAPVIGFVEDNFSMDWGRRWFQDDSRALYLSCT